MVEILQCLSRSVDLQAQQEGKAVFLTNLGSLKLPEILEYMSTFGVVVNLCPSQDRKLPDRLHHVINKIIFCTVYTGYLGLSFKL